MSVPWRRVLLVRLRAVVEGWQESWIFGGQILQGRSMETVWDVSSLSHSLKATQIP